VTVQKKLLTPDFTNGKFCNEYRHLLDNTGVHNTNFTNNITPENYKESSFLVAYDFSPDLNNGSRLPIPKNVIYLWISVLKRL